MFNINSSAPMYDQDAVQHMRNKMQRLHIEGRMPEEISDYWRRIFNEHCSNKGPSISPEHFTKVMHAKTCGSKILLFNG